MNGVDREAKSEGPGRGGMCGVDAGRMRVERADASAFDSGSGVASGQPGADAHSSSFSCDGDCGATDCNADAEPAADGNADRVAIAVATDALCASPATVAGSARRRCARDAHRFTARLPDQGMHAAEPG